jgi:hypothetical protein
MVEKNQRRKKERRKEEEKTFFDEKTVRTKGVTAIKSPWVFQNGLADPTVSQRMKGAHLSFFFFFFPLVFSSSFTEIGSIFWKCDLSLGRFYPFSSLH